jgi:hypothetical protein
MAPKAMKTKKMMKSSMKACAKPVSVEQALNMKSRNKANNEVLKKPARSVMMKPAAAPGSPTSPGALTH